LREPDRDDLERAAARARTALGFLQLGGIAFVAVIALGLVPRIVAARWPSLAGVAQLGALGASALVAIGSVVVGALRLRRRWASEERRPSDDDAPSRRP
jgi:hypothetical protein